MSLWQGDVQDLSFVAYNCWELIDGDRFRELIERMLRRMQAVIIVKGRYSKIDFLIQVMSFLEHGV